MPHPLHCSQPVSQSVSHSVVRGACVLEWACRLMHVYMQQFCARPFFRYGSAIASQLSCWLQVSTVDVAGEQPQIVTVLAGWEIFFDGGDVS